MPRFDQRCTVCAWTGEIVVEPFAHPPCPACGGSTERLWISAAQSIADEIPGGVWIENLGHEPVYFESKSEIVKEARRRGLEPMVRHVPVPGSDKSPHTTSWSAVSPYQLEQARLLLERVGSSTATPTQEQAPVRPLATPELVADVLASFAE